MANRFRERFTLPESYQQSWKDEAPEAFKIGKMFSAGIMFSNNYNSAVKIGQRAAFRMLNANLSNSTRLECIVYLFYQLSLTFSNEDLNDAMQYTTFVASETISVGRFLSDYCTTDRQGNARAVLLKHLPYVLHSSASAVEMKRLDRWFRLVRTSGRNTFKLTNAEDRAIGALLSSIWKARTNGLTYLSL